MTPEQFKSWRTEMKLTQDQAAEALGISKATIGNYDNGVRREDGRAVVIPKAIALACAALTAGLRPAGE